jgi:hypothetical protein
MDTNVFYIRKVVIYEKQIPVIEFICSVLFIYLKANYLRLSNFFFNCWIERPESAYKFHLTDYF